MDINQRLQKLRKALGLSQREFGERIGLKHGAISWLEKSGRTVSDRNIQLICDTFSVNEHWFRTGDGEMFVETDDSLLAQLAAEYKLEGGTLELIRNFLMLTAEQRAAILHAATIIAEANKKAMKIEIAQAIASTAMAAINAYSSAAKVPVIGWTLAPIAAGMATAAGLLQIATIRKQHQAEAAGYYSGGYTGGRRYRREAGVVHEGEFVANHQAVNNSSIRPAFDLIDRAQRANTVGSLTADDISRALGSGGGGAVVTPIVNVSNDNSEVRESLDGVNNAITILNQTLDDGLEIVMPIAGRSGLHRKLKDYERLLDNK